MKAIQPIDDKIKKGRSYPIRKIGLLLLALLLVIYYFLAISTILSNG
jgi:hypothetical protein